MSTEEVTDEVTVPQLWFKLMGIDLGDEIVVLPRAGQPGQGFQGQLVDALFVGNAPIALVIRQDESSPRVTIPWDAVLMVTVPNPAIAAAAAAQQEAQEADISVEDLTAMAKAMGLEVPAEIQALIDGQEG